MREQQSSSAQVDISGGSSEESPDAAIEKHFLRRFFYRILRYLLYGFLAFGWLIIIACLVATAWTFALITRTNPHWGDDIQSVLWHTLRPGIIANYIESPLSLIAFLLVYLALFLICVRATAFALTQRRIRHARNPGIGPVLLGDTWYDPDHDSNRRIMAGTPDPLGYERLATSIADTIMRSANRAPFAIAIEGRWGIGKTTVMKMIERRLKDAYFPLHEEDRNTSWKCFTIWFNPWRHRRWNAQKAFMSAVFADIPWRALKWYTGPVMRGRIISQVANLASFLRGGNGMGNRISNKLDASAPYRDKFRTDFEQFLKYWSEAEGKTRIILVIFVDDLDRCTPSDIAAVLEAMKLFFDSQQCVFVLGFDLDVVAQSIAHELHGHVPEGLAYLQKLVQVEFPLLQPDDARLEVLIGKFEDAMKLQDVFAVIKHEDSDYRNRILECAQRTPRQIKRLMNGVAMLAPLHTADEYYTLFQLLLLQVRWPFIFHQIVREAQQGNLEELVRHILTTIDELEYSG